MAVIKGKAFWAAITKPNTRYDPIYSINLIVSDEIANQFAKNGFRVKKQNEGLAVIIERKVNGPNGMVRPAPKLYDKDNNLIDEMIGNGSYVAVQYNEYRGVSENGPYQGLDLMAVKILNKIEYDTSQQIQNEKNELLDVND